MSSSSPDIKESSSAVSQEVQNHTNHLLELYREARRFADNDIEKGEAKFSGVGSSDDVWRLCRLIDVEYHPEWIECTADAGTVVYRKNQLIFIDFFMDSLRHFFTSEVVLWIFGRVLCSLKDQRYFSLRAEANDLFLGFFHEHLCSRKAHLALLRAVVELLTNLQSIRSSEFSRTTTVLYEIADFAGATVTTVTPSSAGDSFPFKVHAVTVGPIEVRLVDAGQCDTLQCFITSFLSATTDSLRRVEQLSNKNYASLWVTLLHQLDCGSVELKKISLELMTSLLDATQEFRRHLPFAVLPALVDHLFAVFEWLTDGFQLDEHETLIEALSGCLVSLAGWLCQERQLTDWMLFGWFSRVEQLAVDALPPRLLESTGVFVGKLALLAGEVFAPLCSRGELCAAPPLAPLRSRVNSAVSFWLEVALSHEEPTDDGVSLLPERRYGACLHHMIAAALAFESASQPKTLSLFVKQMFTAMKDCLENSLGSEADADGISFVSALKKWWLFVSSMNNSAGSSSILLLDELKNFLKNRLSSEAFEKRLLALKDDFAGALFLLIRLVGSLLCCDLSAASNDGEFYFSVMTLPWFAEQTKPPKICERLQRLAAAISCRLSDAEEPTFPALERTKVVSLHYLALLSSLAPEQASWRQLVFTHVLKKTSGEVLRNLSLGYLPLVLISMRNSILNVREALRSVRCLLSDDGMPVELLSFLSNCVCLAGSGDSAARCADRWRKSLLEGSKSYSCQLCDNVFDAAAEPTVNGIALLEFFDDVPEKNVLAEHPSSEQVIAFCELVISFTLHTSRHQKQWNSCLEKMQLKVVLHVAHNDAAVRSAVCGAMAVFAGQPEELFTDLLKREIQRHLFIDLASENDQANAEWEFRYLVAMIRRANSQDFVSICMVRMMILSSYDHKGANELIGRPHVEQIASHFAVSPRDLFVQFKSDLCYYLAKTMHSDALELSSSPSEKLPLSTTISSLLEDVARLFGFRSLDGEADLKCFLSEALPEIVAALLTSFPAEEETSHIHKQLAILFGTNRHNLLATICFPAVLLRATLEASTDEQAAKIMDFVESEGRTTADKENSWKVEKYYSWNSYNCLRLLLENVSSNEGRVLHSLRQISQLQVRQAVAGGVERNQGCWLTSLLENRLVGLLIHFRSCFTDVARRHAWHRARAARSFLCLVGRLVAERDDGRRLLANNSEKILVVLSAASRHDSLSAELLAEIWLAFVRALPAERLGEMLVELFSLIVAAISTNCRRATGAACFTPIFYYVFVECRTQLAQLNFRRFDELCFLLAGHESASSQSLGRLIPIEPPVVDTNDVMGLCVRLLDIDQTDAKLFTLKKVRSVLLNESFGAFSAAILDSNARLNSNVYWLIGSLMEAAKSNEANVAQLACSCLGLFGALDPGRLGLELAISSTQKNSRSRHNREVVFADFPQRGSLNQLSVPFIAQLLEKMCCCLLSSANSHWHDVCCLAIQQAVRVVGGRIGGGEGVDKEDVDCAFFSAVQQAVSPTTARSMEPLRRSHYTCTQLGDDNSHKAAAEPTIVLCSASSHFDWMSLWTLKSIGWLENSVARRLYSASAHLLELNAEFGQFLLPHVVLEVLLEKSQDCRHQLEVEMMTVLRLAAGDAELASSGCLMRNDDKKLCANSVFRVLDLLNQYVERYRRLKPFEVKLVQDVLHVISSGGQGVAGRQTTYLTEAAATCHMTARALMAYERTFFQFPKNAEESELFSTESLYQRNEYYQLEKLYAELGDVDGVEGSLAQINRRRSASERERIVAYEAAGDYAEALPFHQQIVSRERSAGSQLARIHCLLKLDQPQLAAAQLALFEQQHIELDQLEKRQVRNAHLEAAWQLQNWDGMEQLVAAGGRNEQNSRRQPALESVVGEAPLWAESLASLFVAMRKRDDALFGRLLSEARRCALAPVASATTLDPSLSYQRSYKHITQLAIISEIEQAAKQWIFQDVEAKDDEYGIDRRRTELGSPVCEALSSPEQFLRYVEGRTKLMQQSSKSLEPMLAVYRNLLSFSPWTDRERQELHHRLWLHSARVARTDGHLQTAWGYIVKASTLNCDSMLRFIEEAKYQWQKGDKRKAVNLLETGLKNQREAFGDTLPVTALDGAEMGPSDDEEERKVNRTLDAAQAKLLHAEYMEAGGEADLSRLKDCYNCCMQMSRKSDELVAYKAAVFVDQTVLMKTQHWWENVQMVKQVLAYYSLVLSLGHRYLHHAMPRIITVWLDAVNQNYQARKTAVAAERRAAAADDKNAVAMANEQIRKNDQTMAELNTIVDGFFDNYLPRYQFYSVFSQLISSVGAQQSSQVFKLLKKMLANLLAGMPSQCVWLSVGVYRGSEQSSHKQQRMKQVLEEAGRLNANIPPLLDDVLYLSEMLIKLAKFRRPSSSGTSRAAFKLSLQEQFPHLFHFFPTGGGASSFRRSAAAVMVPLQAFFDLALPISSVVEATQLIGNGAERRSNSSAAGCCGPTTSLLAQPVFIHAIEDEVFALKSIQCPKKITLVGSDGKRYPVMCKPDDDLRKDKRLMDFNQVINASFRQTPEARRRQLHIRTYSVVPLGTDGGMIEWVPNLIAKKEALQPLLLERGRPMDQVELYSAKINPAKMESNADKLHSFRENYLRRYPPVMSEWFCRSFPDPDSWYAARLAFTRTAAVMSIVGFVLGLGDRHAENILLDTTNGETFHVDFNLLFNKGEELQVKEVVPFRLTRNILDGFGPLQHEGAFRKSCEVTMDMLRKSRLMLMTILQTFVHDPLVEWSRTSKRLRPVEQPQQQQEQQYSNSLVIGTVEKEQMFAGKTVLRLIDSRLSGNIETLRVYRRRSAGPQLPFSVEGQVDQLINLAKSHDNLCQMYVGWAPFL